MTNNYKISIIGAGAVGTALASLLYIKNLADVVLVSRNGISVQGKILDIQHTCATNKSIIGTNKYADISDSDIVVITSGQQRTVDLSRNDLLIINTKIMHDICMMIKEYTPKAFIIVVTNPLDIMTHVASILLEHNKKRIVGISGILDSNRARSILSKQLSIPVNEISIPVIGEHGDNMLVLLNHCKIQRQSLGSFIKNHIYKINLEEIVKSVKQCGINIIQLMGRSANFSPAYSIYKLIEDYINDSSKEICCSVYLDDIYGINNTFLSAPILLRDNMIDKVIELKLNNVQKSIMQDTAKGHKILIDKCLKSLNFK